MEKKQLSDNLKQIDDRLNGVIENVNYAKVRHKSTAVITCCGNASYSLKDIQKKLTEIAASLAEEEKQLSEGISKNAGKISGVIEDVEYAKVHYKSTAVITSCGNAAKELKEIKKDLAEIEASLGVSKDQSESESESEPMGL